MSLGVKSKHHLCDNINDSKIYSSSEVNILGIIRKFVRKQTRKVASALICIRNYPTLSKCLHHVCVLLVSTNMHVLL